jgi:hypothetical protein
VKLPEIIEAGGGMYLGRVGDRVDDAVKFCDPRDGHLFTLYPPLSIDIVRLTLKNHREDLVEEAGRSSHDHRGNRRGRGR